MEANLKSLATAEIAERNQIYTIGYECLRPDGLVVALQTNAIQTVVDVRQRAASRRRGFAKTSLRELLSGEGIAYHHLPLLGTPATLRQQLRSNELQIDQYLNLYREHLDDNEAAVIELEQLISGGRCCLLCLEADHRVCHRAALASLLAERSGCQLTVHHIAATR
jgi:uncharacterized protein (DUF488 family)